MPPFNTIPYFRAEKYFQISHFYHTPISDKMQIFFFFNFFLIKNIFLLESRHTFDTFILYDNNHRAGHKALSEITPPLHKVLKQAPVSKYTFHISPLF